MSFEGKTVWITGASSGIGAALAIEFAQRGARCALSARRTDRLEAVRAACAQPDRHLVQAFDAAAFDTHATAADEVEERLGPVDILVLNAGIGQRGYALETDLGIASRIMDVNFTGAISLTGAVAPRMVGRGSGRLVVIDSILAHISIPGSSAYSASKYALRGYFESLRGEIKPHGVEITMVSPGYINTEITVHALQADGSTFGIVDHNHTYGMDADVCARKVAQAVEKGRPTLRVGGRETLAVPLARLLPGVARYFSGRYARK